MNIFKTTYYLEQLIQHFDMRNFYKDLEERAPKFFDFIQKIGGEEAEQSNQNFCYRNWSIKEMMAKGTDFYYEINPIFEARIYNFISRYNTFIDAQYDDIENGVIMPVANSTIIKLGLPPDLRGPMTVVHEYGHILSQKYQHDLKAKTTSLNEIGSIFFEKLYLYKQLQKGDVSKQDVERILIERQNDTKLNIQHLLREREIVKSLGEPVTIRSVLKTKFTLRGKDYKQHSKDMKSKEYILGIKAMEYVIGEITASALMEDYVKNPGDVLKRVEIFLDNSSVVSENQAFTILLGDKYEQKLGFSFKDNSQNFAEHTK